MVEKRRREEMPAPTEAAQSDPEAGTAGGKPPALRAEGATRSPVDALEVVEPSIDDRRAKTIETKDLNLFYGDFHAVENVTMTIAPNKVTALIGSSGCGKTTFLRSLNRMHELTL